MPGSLVNTMDLVFFNGQMALSTRANGKTVGNMEKESILELTEQHMKECGIMAATMAEED